MNLAKCADAVLTTADLLSGRPTELLYSFCSFGSFLFADSFPRAIFPLSAMTALLFHLSVLVIWKFAISQPVYYRAYDFSDNAGQCTHTHTELAFSCPCVDAACARMRSAEIHIRAISVRSLRFTTSAFNLGLSTLPN